ncbi:MAG: restriction endonuclease subunit S [Methanomicrobiales archaeon HGW-Methanomicrobiales-1]|jgi:type I restriction enzyme S subunit|nr:MAG: restriction endonuclease subunit S [Methanomicrobiales archaeon HGW-Methanomicrobiales-1]
MKKPVVISPEPSCFPDDELPEGWKFVTILDACEVNPHKPSKDFLPADAPVTFIPMPAVDADMGAITNPQIKPYLEVRNGFTSFRDGDVIMAKITPCMENGKAAIVTGMKNGIGFGSTEFHVMRSRGEIMPEYLYYYIRQESFRNEAESHFTGSVGQKRVPADFIKQSMIPLPPLTEQQRIVARIEAMITHINAARNQLSRVPLIMKKFRQAVLAAACSGRLTEGWREENLHISQLSNQIKLKNYRVPDFIEDISEIPASWKYVTVGSVGRVKGGKRLPKGSELVTKNTGFPYLRAGNLKNGSVLGEIFYLEPEIQVKISRYVISSSDIYITIVGACIGDSGTVPEKFNGANLTENAAKICNLEGIDNHYLALVFRSPLIQEQINGKIFSATLGKLALNRIAQLIIPLPPLAEQDGIVRRVGLLFERADAFDQEVAAAGRRCERLTQAVLGKAFSGRL